VLRLIDTHAHLEEIENLGEAIAEAKAANVIAIIAVGSDYQSNQKVLELAQIYKGFVYPALGLHPYNLQDTGIGRTLEFIEAHIEQVVGIGEIGLDYHKKVREVAEKDVQKSVLGKLLEIAQKYNKPVSIHSRYAWRDALSLVAEAQIEKAVFHWYTGTSSIPRGTQKSNKANPTGKASSGNRFPGCVSAG